MNQSTLTTKCYICGQIIEFGYGEVEQHTYYNHPEVFYTVFSKIKKNIIIINKDE
jgi:hypothetical protein